MSNSWECCNWVAGPAPFQPRILSFSMPLPAILILSSTGYLSIALLIYALYLKFHPTKKYRGDILKSQPSDCCITAADACNCCNALSIDACLSGICPQRKAYDCADLIFCQFCVGGHRMSPGPPMIECPVCCQSIYCEDTNICCFYCNFRERSVITQEL